MTLAQRLEASWAARGPLNRLLLPLAWLYGAAVRLRRALARPERLPVPVIVVGNLVAGGAGKTPAVLAVVELLRRRGWTPGIVSRGYGRSGGAPLAVARDMPFERCGDEPLLLQRRSAAPVWVGDDRVAAARELLRQQRRVDVIVADDGLQHDRLARDAQLIVFDERGAGNGWLLPAGPLREPMALRPPARSVVLYNAPGPSTAWPGGIARRGLAGVLALDAWWHGEPARRDALAALAGRHVLAVAGVARPGRFFAMLRAAGLAIDELALPDHHAFATLPWPPATPEVVVTEKDAVKLRPERIAPGTQVWVATLDFALDAASEESLVALLPPCRGD